LKEKKWNVLKRLAGSKWGSSRSVLDATYTAYIKPALQYVYEALITATAAGVIQNQALRLITGAVKSTPLASYASTRYEQALKN
jgi:hypothetical protein